MHFSTRRFAWGVSALACEMAAERMQFFHKLAKTEYNFLDELPLVLRVEDLMPILDIGRNTAYELVHSGQIRSIKVGRQIRVPRDAVVDFLQGRMKSI